MRKEKKAAKPQPETPVKVAEAPAPSRMPWWVAVALLAAAIYAYLPAIKGPAVFDDISLPPFLPGGATAWYTYLTGVRPLYYVSLAINYAISGADPLPYHLFSWFLHIFTTVIVYFLLTRIMTAFDVPRDHVWPVAVFGAGVFLLHPLQTESVSYIASRSEVQSVFFGYLALLIYLGKGRERVSIVRAATVLLLFLAGLATKEHIVALVAVFVVCDWLMYDGGWRAIVRNAMLYAPLAVGAVAGGAYVLRKASATGGNAGFVLKDVTPVQYLITQFKVIWLYPRYLLLPVGQNIDHGIEMSKSLADIGSLLGLVALIAGLAAAWIFRKRFPLAAMGFAIFLVLLAPTSSIVPIADAFAERRIYLPFIGLLLIAAEGLRRLDWKQWHVPAAASAVLLVLTLLCSARSELYANQLLMWQDSVAKNPKNGRAHFSLGYYYYTRNQCVDAVKEFEIAAPLQKPNYNLYTDWALSLDCAGRVDEAIEKAHLALKIDNLAHGWATIGMFEAKRGNTNGALAALDQAAKLDPNFAATYAYRGNVYLMAQRFPEAIEEYQKCLKLDPSDEMATTGLMQARRGLESMLGLRR